MRKIKFLKIAFLLRPLIFLVLLLAFQNCSDFAPIRGEISETQQSQNLNSNIPKAQPCFLGSIEILSGSSINAFSNNVVAYNQSCESIKQIRNCQNGILDGDPAYSETFCSASAARSCFFNGQNLVNGASVTMYMRNVLPYGSDCDSSSNKETRTCIDGSMTGSALHSTCSVDQASSCSINGKILAHGASQVFYNSPVIEYGSGSCLSQTRTCNNGSADGQYIYSQCEVITKIESIPLSPCLSNNLFGTYYSFGMVCGHPNYRAVANGTEKLEFRTNASGTEVWGINVPNVYSGYDAGAWECGGMTRENRLLCTILPGQSSCSYGAGWSYQTFTAVRGSCGSLQYQQPSYDSGGSSD